MSSNLLQQQLASSRKSVVVNKKASVVVKSSSTTKNYIAAAREDIVNRKNSVKEAVRLILQTNPNFKAGKFQKKSRKESKKLIKLFKK